MSFTKRGLAFVIQLNAGDDAQGQSSNYLFDNGADTLNIQGIRSMVSCQSVTGGDVAFAGQALIQLWGMKPADMAQLSTLGFDQKKFGINTITVFAYDEDNPSGQVEVFSGGIFNAHINYNAMPDVSLELECWSTINQQVQSIAGTSVQGVGDVAAMLKGICAASNPPVTFVNHGVVAKLANPAYAGSQYQQIESICCDAGIPHTFHGNTLTIWPNGTNADGVIITTGPGLGMVGYPEYNLRGLDVTMEFNPEVQLWRQLTILQGSNDLPVPGVPGTFWINVVTHELSCEMPGGPWFTHASVSERQIGGRS